MNSFEEYQRNSRDELGLPLRKVATELEIDTSILSKIEHNERTATKEMLQTFSETIIVDLKELEIKFIVEQIEHQFGDLKNIKLGLEATIQDL